MKSHKKGILPLLGESDSSYINGHFIFSNGKSETDENRAVDCLPLSKCYPGS